MWYVVRILLICKLTESVLIGFYFFYFTFGALDIYMFYFVLLDQFMFFESADISLWLSRMISCYPALYNFVSIYLVALFVGMQL